MHNFHNTNILFSVSHKIQFMKNRNLTFALLAGCLIVMNQSVFSNPVKLHEALKDNKIKGNIHGNSSSTHYLEPIILELSNTGNETVTVAVEDGDMFIPSDADKQNIVVTATQSIVLLPKEKKSVPVKGMCTEPSDAAGNDQTLYTFIPQNDEKLQKLSKFIQQKGYQSSAGQYAVWCLVSDKDINSIYSSDSTEENELKKFMATLTGKTFAIKSNKDYRTNYYAPPRERVGGNFEYSFSKAQDIQIAMFDKNGILVRELFNQKKVPAGTHKLNFEYDSSVYTEDVYYFKLIVGNEVMVNRKWDAQAMRDSFKHKIENRE